MSKRFIETSIWIQNKWFRKLTPELKLLWFYLISNCDSVGVWEEDVELASFIIGYNYNIDDLKSFDDRLVKFNGKKYWIKDFCDFQYGELKEENDKNKPHQSYILLLKKHSLWKDYTYSLKRVKEKEKDKEKDKDTETDKEKDDVIFDFFRKKFPGIKRGNETEFDNFKKKHKDWKEVLPTLSTIIDNQITFREQRKANKEFVPEWKNLQTWINQRCWEEEETAMSLSLSDQIKNLHA